MIPQHVIKAFNIKESICELTGGCQKVYRAGNVVVKRIFSDSLESQHSVPLALWLAEIFNTIADDGFRLSRPLLAVDGRWMLSDGWMACSYLDGESATSKDTPKIIESIISLNYALKDYTKHSLLDSNETAWGYAHYHCFENMPHDVHPQLYELVSKLYEKCKPLPGLKCQLIHGDLNLGNIIIAPGKPAGFIDFTPFWAPAEFALAMFANWVGPRAGDLKVLEYFKNINNFDQLLIRASIRMLLIVSHLNGVNRCEKEQTAAELVLSYVS